jgi:hypothetical protein
MIAQTSQDVSFLNLNVLLIGVVGLLVFAYLVMIIRRRWRSKFLHDKGKKDQSSP